MGEVSASWAWYCSPMLTPSDLVTIAPAAASLAKELADALHKDGPGGAVVTREERKRVLAVARELVVVLARDIID